MKAESPERVKVHVILKEEVCQNRDTRTRTVDRIVAASGITGINEKRLERHGIVSGAVPKEAMPALQAIEGVKAVELDTEKHALAR
jgi:hypothetical protein